MRLKFTNFHKFSHFFVENCKFSKKSAPQFHQCSSKIVSFQRRNVVKNGKFSKKEWGVPSRVGSVGRRFAFSTSSWTSRSRFARAKTPNPSRTPHGRPKMTSHADRLRRQTEFLNEFLNKYEYEYDDQIVCAEVEKSLFEKKMQRKNVTGTTPADPTKMTPRAPISCWCCVVLLALRERKAGSAGNEICGWTLKP